MRELERGWIGQLTTRELFLGTWVPIILITLGHYLMPSHMHWAHDIFRRLYYLPIIYASVRGGVRVGCIVALVIIVSYLPHAFMGITRYDPARGMEKALEMVIYLGAAWLGGFLSEREKRQRRALQKALRRQQELLDQLVRAGRLSALGEVVAGIAHEIKNPLHSLLGTAEIIDPLISKGIPERRMWENHLEELKRLQRTSDRFLNFASPAAQEVTVVDLREVVGRLEGLIGTECQQRGIALELDLPPKAIPVKGNSDQLVQVALNIALNGLKAMEKSGATLRVSASLCEVKEEEMVALSLANDGPRIPAEEVEKIFDPFHTSEPGGTGLGLSISSRIIQRHDGFIEAQNSHDGVCFTIYLPISTP